ncbi:aldose epimerase family protein [Fictibacillus enclensis]|uniref:aldose epimerase family protein n=1 Tax=Fictibacillus enclensis TaxID=1017270 RepID=UPI0025A0822F|nr:aldose epimerase family protein [Fictibacillus enclensis]MDM5197318.1 aldose epimerase family protein [Fictibacillus enclensis]
MKVIQENFGTTQDQDILAYTMINSKGMEVSAINYGAIITCIMAPDKEGNLENVVLGHDTLEDYLKDTNYLGAIAGRVAGRIQSGSFELDGQEYTLAKNDGNNHLHGGNKGFNAVVWNAEVIEEEEQCGVKFSYVSPDGEEGYPGRVGVDVTYLINDENTLSISYSAQSDKKTLLNLTNHSYFNLSGNLKHDIQDHTLQLKSDQFLELDQELIPTGRALNVQGTPFDLRKGQKVKTGTTADYEQNKLAGGGYDHPFLLTTNQNNEIVLKEETSGRTLTVETDQKCVVVYSGNMLDSNGEFRDVPSRKHLGICLETQGVPDAIHHSQFPSVVLDAGEEYQAHTTYTFGVE